MELVSSTRYRSRNRIAITLPVEQWIDTKRISDHAKRHLRKIFTQTGWQVINPEGDGFCGVNAIRIGRMLIERTIGADIPSDILTHTSKYELLEQIIRGMVIYRKTRQSLIKDLAKYSENKITKEEITQIEYIYDDMDEEIKKKINNIKNRLRATSRNIIITNTLLDMLVVMMREYNAFVGEDKSFNLSFDDDFTFDGTSTTLNDAKIAELYSLTDPENVHSAVIYFLAYFYQHNFIILYYIAFPDIDRQLFTASISYISYQIQTTRSLMNDEIIFKSRDSSNVIDNTSLLFHDGDFVLFHNPNLDIKKAVLSMFIFERNRFILGKEDNIWGTWDALGPTADLLFEIEIDPLAAGGQHRKKKQKQKLTQKQKQKQKLKLTQQRRQKRYRYKK